MSDQKSILQIFKDQRTAKNNLDAQEARRLVNLYRSLSCFGSTFIDQYNQMLLDSKPGVRRLFSTFMGGNEVADYLEFLQQSSTHSSEETPQNSATAVSPKGYLPDPVDDLSSNGPSKGNTERELERLEEQQKILMDQMQKLIQKMSNGSNGAGKMATSLNTESYSEIVEENAEEKGKKIS